MTNVFIYDPTTTDDKSAVRGIGRYLQILKENFPNWIFSSKIENWKLEIGNSIFINPFFNFLQKPPTFKRIAKKQIAVIHDLIPLKYPQHFPAGIRGNLNIFLNKIALKNYDLIVTDSQASKKDIVQILKIAEEKVKVVYPCLPKIFNKKLKTQKSKVKTETQNFKTEQNNKDKKFLDLSCSFDICDLSFELDKFCLYVGDATWNKNLVNLAYAIKLANVTCVLVGKVFESLKVKKFKSSNKNFLNLKTLKPLNFNHPWQKELNEFFKLTKDDKRFIFLGFVDDYRLIKLYQQARVNLLLSYDEGFGLSYLEAASQGCPSVLSNIPVLKEISSGNALLADPKNPNDLADKIIQIYFDDNLRQNLVLGALKQAKKYKSDNFKKSFLDVIYG